MEKLTIDVFVPIIAELNELKTKAEAVDITDLKATKEMRLELKSKRVEVVKKMKAYRDDANAFSKLVIVKEKELVGIIAPAEDKFKQIEAQIEHDKEMELRKAVLPERKEKLTKLEDSIEVTDEKILEMDGAGFQEYYNQRLADKNEADRSEIARVQAEQAEKEQALENEKIAREREDKARKEGAKKAKQDAKDKADKILADAKAKEQKEKDDAEQAKKDEAEKKAKRERADRYKAFRTEHGYTEETRADYWEDVKGDTVTLYKKVGTFDLTELK